MEWGDVQLIIPAFRIVLPVLAETQDITNIETFWRQSRDGSF